MKSRTAARPAPEAATAASILALIQSIERHDAGSPATIAFSAALARKGAEAHAASGPEALDALQREVVTADPDRAESRAAILAAAWSGLSLGSTR